MPAETAVFLSIGSNIEPLRQIPRCIDLLAQVRDSALFAESTWYRTRPWGIEKQSEFVNLVVGLNTRLSPRELLGETQAIEYRLDRVRELKNGPRTIDLDILLFGDRILAEADLSLPHPGLLLRDFMLIPLIEIAPGARHPQRDIPVSALEGEIRYRQIIGPLAH